jgi:hypothetical protein
MRFMVLVKSTPDSEAGVMPPADQIEAMMAFNKALHDEGLLKDAAGLHPSSRGARIAFDGDERSVVPGPFQGELLSGYWLVEAPSLDAVVARFMSCPNPSPGFRTHIEIRKEVGPEDFADALPDTIAAEWASLEAAASR